jgi:hypothetical protein
VWAGAINIRRLFHRLALRAAILARRHGTRADGVCAFLAFRICHESSPLPLAIEISPQPAPSVVMAYAMRHTQFLLFGWVSPPSNIYIK